MVLKTFSLQEQQWDSFLVRAVLTCSWCYVCGAISQTALFEMVHADPLRLFDHNPKKIKANYLKVSQQLNFSILFPRYPLLMARGVTLRTRLATILPHHPTQRMLMLVMQKY